MPAVRGVAGDVVAPRVVMRAHVVGLRGCMVAVAMPRAVSWSLLLRHVILSVVVIAVGGCIMVGPGGGGQPHIHWRGWQ